MSNDTVGQMPNRQAERAEVTVEVGLEFDSFQGFLSEYSSNISIGGMFVKAANPPPIGTVLHFTLKLKGDFQLIKGTGEVMWARLQGQGPRLPPGMGIRFLAIPESGVDLIHKMVERYRDQGGRPFDVEALSQPPGAGTDLLEEGSAEGLGQHQMPGQRREPAPWETSRDSPEELTGSFNPDIFIPPDVLTPHGSSTATSTVDSLGGGSESQVSDADKGEGSTGAARAPRRVRLSLVVFLLFVAGLAGALAFAFGERLVNWSTGYDSSLEQPQVIDVPPPVSLSSEPVPLSKQPVFLNKQQALADPSAVDSEATPEDQTSVADSLTGDGGEDLVAEGPTIALNRVRLITWKEAPGGNGTLVTFWGDGHLADEHLVQVRFGDRPPRELMKLQGVNWPFRDPVLDVDSPEVRRIRTGFHPKSTLNELHIVIDLADPEVRLVSLERGPRNIELLFQR